MMRRRDVILAALALAGAAGSAQAGAAALPTPIRFRRGATSATVTGQVRGFGTAIYSLDARAGQRMRVRLSSANTFLFFNVTTPSGETLFNSSEDAEPDQWVGQLPESGPTRIDIYLMRNEARRRRAAVPFTLTVAIV